MLALARNVKQYAKGELSHVEPRARLVRLVRSSRPTLEITNVRMAQCTLLLALLGTAAYGADVYRTRAADGTITYSDRPEGDNSEFVVVTTPRTGTAAAPQQRAQPGQRAAANTENPAAEPPQAAASPPPLEAGPSAAELRAQRQKNCDTARERLERFTLSRRLYRNNAAGEREYLSDEATAEARSKAQADVQDWCG
jgi:hypothetical protein